MDHGHVAPLPALLSRIGNNPGLVLELIDIFHAESDQMVAELRRSIAAHDHAGVYAAAHRLRGSLRIFAADHAAETVVQLESMGRAADLSEAPARLRSLVDELSRITATLVSYRTQLSSSDQPVL